MANEDALVKYVKGVDKEIAAHQATIAKLKYDIKALETKKRKILPMISNGNANGNSVKPEPIEESENEQIDMNLPRTEIIEQVLAQNGRMSLTNLHDTLVRLGDICSYGTVATTVAIMAKKGRLVKVERGVYDKV